jgi:hypothetical protein
MIKRLHELTKAERGAVSLLLRGEIKPASIDAGCTWVCLKQQPHFWSAEMVERVAERDKETAVAWVAFDGKAPIGVCFVVGVGEIRPLTCFLVADRADRWEIADATALVALKDLAADGCLQLWSWFMAKGFAAEYAERCGFRSSQPGTTVIPDPNPLLLWEIGVKELEQNILKEADAHLS